ncbi:MAG: FAD/NAD(P)-binding protein [Propionibacteriales bacterium]|nr:FAD/NAD(P)-binding protein [Propionibacteriales bacterium]
MTDVNEKVAFEPFEPSHERFDIAFVGSGLSATFTTIRLLEGLLAEPGPRPLRILHLDQSGEFFTGIAYGARSGRPSLTITPLDEFLPEAELPEFVAWLSTNADTLLEELGAQGGLRTEEWLVRAESDLRAGTCSRLHIPRFFFGRYLCARVEDLISQGRTQGVLESMTLLSAEATSLARRGGRYRLGVVRAEVDDDEETFVSADQVVVAIGMPPTRGLFGETGAVPALLVDNPYVPGLDQTFAQIADHVARVDGRPEILVVGANAGCLEFLYALTNHPALESVRANVRVLSPQGQLPERFHKLEAPSFDAVHLEDLTRRSRVTAVSIREAAQADVAAAKRAGVTISDSLPNVSKAVGALLSSLDAEELREFAAFAGVEIGRLQRRAGDEYCDAADFLIREGRLATVAGRYHDVQPASDGVSVRYVEPGTSEMSTFETPMHVVVNCSGPAPLRSPSTSRFIESLLTSGLLPATPAGRGFSVDNGMAGAEGLYVNGPLLSGNVVADRPVWHVEHCGRVIQFSAILAGHVRARLRQPGEDDGHAA